MAREGSSGVQPQSAKGLQLPTIVDTSGGWHKESPEALIKLGRQVGRLEVPKSVQRRRLDSDPTHLWMDVGMMRGKRPAACREVKLAVCVQQTQN